MALPGLTFTVTNNGLGRPLAGEDHISGFVFYIDDANIPAGFATTSTATRVKKVFSLAEAEALGIAEGGTYTSGQWYHVSEYFRMNPKGELWIGIFDIPSGTYDFEEVRTMQDFVGGTIRQFGVWADALTFATSQLTSIQTILTALDTDHKPAVALYAADISATANVTSLTTLRGLTAKEVSCVIGEDGDEAGRALAVASTNSVSCLGAALGLLSSLKVHESIGWVERCNVATGAELDVAAFSNLQLANAVATSAQTTLDTYGYVFLRKFVGLAGTFFNFGHTAIATTSDYCTLENNRTIHKAKRNLRSFLLPLLNSPMYVNADGQLSEETIAIFKNNAKRALESMQVDGEISAFSVNINPLQEVLSTSTITINIQIVPVGVAKNISVNIGYTLNIA